MSEYRSLVMMALMMFNNDRDDVYEGTRMMVMVMIVSTSVVRMVRIMISVTVLLV